MISVDELMARALPDGWMWKTMGDIADVVSGGTPSTSDASNFENGEIPWLTPADLSGYAAKFVSGGARKLTPKGLQSCSAKLIPAGAVLFTSRAPIGYVAIASNPISTNQGFKNFVLREGVLPEYVYWWLKGAKQLAESLASGTTFLEISGTNAKKLPIPIAPFAKQREIVAELEKQFSRLDEAVTNLQRVKANLKRYKASVLKAAVEGRLVETEATLARREGRTYETGEQLLRRILEERRAKWAGKGKYQEPAATSVSDLGELPDGWTWASAVQACEQVVDCHNKTAPYTSSGIPLVRTTNIKDGRLLLEDTRFVDQPTYEFWSRRCPPKPGDVLFTREAPMGEAGIIPPGVKLCLGQRTMLMRPSPAISSSFLLSALLSPVVKDLIDRVAVGSGVKHLRVGDVERLPVPLPPVAEQTRIVAEVDRHLSIIREVEAEVDTNLQCALALRQAILSKFFSIKEA